MAQRETYDVIVIGLGAVGGAAAYQLARRGAAVLGIDQHTPPHTFGSSHGESRITRQAVGEGPQYLPLVQRTNTIWREIEATTGETLLHPAGGYIIEPKHGAAQFHGQQGFVARSAQIATENGIPHEVRDGAAVRAHVPALRTSDDDHAYYEPDAGVLLVEKCIAAQAALAAQHGATLHTGEHVLAVEPSPGGVAVRTDRDTYLAEKVILAAGAWNGKFLPAPQAEVLGVYRQVMFWFEADDLSAFEAERFPWVIWIGETLDDFFAAFPCTPGGTRGVKLMTETYHHRADPDALRREVSEDETRAMYDTYIKRRLRGVGPGLVRAAACAYTVTPDEHFVIDTHPASERVLVASACSGHGFKHAAAVGEGLAERALGEKTTCDLSAFGFARLLSENR